MPYLNKPSFPVSFVLEDTAKAIEETLKSKHWHDFKVASISLKFVPFYLFNFDAFSETEKEGQKIVSGSTQGKTAMNAVSSDLWEEVAFSLEGLEPALSRKPEIEYEFEVQKLKISREEAKNIAALKIASLLSLPKENIIVSGIHAVYVPFWIASVSVAEGNYKIVYSAVNGEVISSEEIPEREKGWLEVTGELLIELQQPGAWVKYGKQALGSGNPLFGSRDGNGSQTFNLLYIALIIILVFLILDFLEIVSIL